MFQRSQQSNAGLGLVIFGICIWLFMPNKVNVTIQKSVVVPVIATLAITSFVRNIRF